jgi:small subunit ribosomal protein S17
MAKILSGKVVSVAMSGVAVVEVTRKKPHPLYKKLLKRSKKFKVALQGKTVALGDTVSIQETRPLSKDTHFILHENGKEKKSQVTSAKSQVSK